MIFVNPHDADGLHLVCLECGASPIAYNRNATWQRCPDCGASDEDESVREIGDALGDGDVAADW